MAALIYKKSCHSRYFQNVTSYQNLTKPNDGYLLEEQSCQILSRSDLKHLCLGAFLSKCHPNKKKNEKKNKMSSSMRSVPDSKRLETASHPTDSVKPQKTSHYEMCVMDFEHYLAAAATD